MATKTKTTNKLPFKTTFESIETQVGGRVADIADSVYRANAQATLADLRNELESIVGDLEEFIEGAEDGEDTMLKTIR